MSLGLRLESFASPGAAPPPAITVAELVEARRAGIDEGRAAAARDAAIAAAAALQDIAAALAAATAAGRESELAWRADAAVLAQAVIARLAQPLRAASLAERVVLALQRRVDGPSGAGCRIRCAAELVRPLAAALAGAGIAGVEVIAGAGPVEVSMPGGALRIDMAGFEADLDRLASEFGQGET